MIEYSKQFVSYSTKSMSNGGELRSIFKSNLYTSEFLHKFAEYIKNSYNNESWKDISCFIVCDVFEAEQQIKISLSGTNHDPVANGNVAAQLAYLPANGLVENENWNKVMNCILLSNYGTILYNFICENYSKEVIALIGEDAYKKFREHNYGDFLVNIFKFNDSGYVQNGEHQGLKETSSVTITL